MSSKPRDGVVMGRWRVWSAWSHSRLLMLIVQQNCRKEYECTISALEAWLGLDVGVVYIQESFLGKRDISHSGFNLYWLSETDNQKDMQVLTAVRKNILNKVLIENQTDLVSHPYCFVLDIEELHSWSRKVMKKTRVINIYNNKFGRRQLWERSSTIMWQAIQDIPWKQIIQGQVVIVGDMNAHSTIWNPHYCQKQNASSLEKLIKTYKLMINNDTNFPTHWLSQSLSTIDLALTNSELGPLWVWEIPKKYPSLSNYELIIIEWEDMQIDNKSKKRTIMRSWNIQKLSGDKKFFQFAKDK